MYKRITHTIVEQHYSRYPAAGLRPRATAIISQDKLISDLRQFMDVYLSAIDELILGVTGELDSIAVAEELLFTNINDMGNYLKSYYGLEFGEKINNIQSSLAFAMISIIRNMRAGIDVTEWKMFRFNNVLLSDIAQYLVFSNNQWRFGDIKNIVTRLTSAWVNEAHAVLDNDTTALQTSKDAARNAAYEYVGLIASGTINKFPELFN